MGFFSFVPLALSLRAERSLGAQEWLPPRLPFLRAYRARVTEHSQGPFLPCGSCHTWGRKRELQASDACLSGLPFPLQTPSVGSGPAPCPLALSEQLGVIFAARLVKEQERSCPGLSSAWGCTEGQRLGRSRAGCVSPRERELGCCRPGPRTFSKSLLSRLLFQPLSLFPRVCGSGLPHFSPPSCSNNS